MLYPYCRRFPPRPPCAIDRWVGPEWRLLEKHAVEIAAQPGVALDALVRLRLRELPAVRGLLTLRGLGRPPETTLLEFFSTPPFVLLEEVRGTELVGGVMIPGRAAGGHGPARRQPRSPAEFERSLADAPLAAIATFRAESGERGTILWTETWVRARGAFPTIAFAAYWLAIGPFSAWIRRIFLREARRVAAGIAAASRGAGA
jgi:hypothetical protein